MAHALKSGPPAVPTAGPLPILRLHSPVILEVRGISSHPVSMWVSDLRGQLSLLETVTESYNVRPVGVTGQCLVLNIFSYQSE